MKKSAPRFVTPISTPRLRGARLPTAFSPKLGRTVRAFDHAAFKQLGRLEVNPGVISIFEHSWRAGANDDGPLIDFWAARPGQEEMLVVERGNPVCRRNSIATAWAAFAGYSFWLAVYPFKFAVISFFDI